MIANSFVFQDFHLHGASAPEWNQRYLQMSPGVMRSSLSEWREGGVHVFRKWMSERVVQQGGLPRGQLCIALLGAHPPGGMRVQGREFSAAELLVLRGGDTFEFQRPAGVELLSVTFDAQAFLGHLDAARWPAALWAASTQEVMVAPTAELDALRRLIRARAWGATAANPLDLMRAAGEVLGHAARAPAQRASGLAAARLVEACHEIAQTEYRGHPVAIEELCRRLHTSRRTLQASFNRVADTSPAAYLRNLRLNTVRRRLMASPARGLTVSQAATEAGFDHLSRFAGEYKALFGEVPSRTRRRGQDR